MSDGVGDLQGVRVDPRERDVIFLPAGAAVVQCEGRCAAWPEKVAAGSWYVVLTQSYAKSWGYVAVVGSVERCPGSGGSDCGDRKRMPRMGRGRPDHAARGPCTSRHFSAPNRPHGALTESRPNLNF